MATLFTLLMWLLLLRGLLHNKLLTLLGSVACYGLAVLSKEHAIMAPAVAAMLVVLVKGLRWQLLKQLAPTFILYGLIAAYVFYCIRHGQLIANAYEPRAAEFLHAFTQANPGFNPDLAYPLSVLTQTTLFFKYLLVWVLPHPLWMSIDMPEQFAITLFSWPYTAGFLAFLLYGCMALHLLLKRGHAGLMRLAMLGPWVMFATELATVRIQETFVIYRSYLWMPMLSAGLPFIFRSIAPIRAMLLLLMVAIVMLPVTWNRLETFSDELLLWNDAARLTRYYGNRPGVERIYLNRGISYYERGQHRHAIRDLDAALAIQPKYIEALTTHGAARMALGELEQAMQDFVTAIRLNPRFYQPYLGKGRIHELRNELDAARAHYKASCELCSRDACSELKRIAG